jgi:hypothetical protein
LHKLSIQSKSPDEKKKKKEEREKGRKKKKEGRKEEKMVMGLLAVAATPWVWRKKEAAPCDPARPTTLQAVTHDANDGSPSSAPVSGL